MANFFAALFGGTKHDKDMKRLRPLVESVKKEYGWAESLKDEDFPRITAEWKEERLLYPPRCSDKMGLLRGKNGCLVPEPRTDHG